MINGASSYFDIIFVVLMIRYAYIREISADADRANIDTRMIFA